MRRSKKQPLVVLSADENRRLSSFCELLMTIDRRVKARSKQKRSHASSRTKKSAQHTKEVRPSDGLFYCSKIFNLLTNPRNVAWHALRTNRRHGYDLVLCM
jgi:hypothetical protein